MTTEFTIRACGADKAALKHLVCRFPLAFRPDPASEATANAPDLKRPGESWAMGQMEEAEARPGTRGLPGQWVLEGQSGRPRFVGQPEGGLRDTGAGYFLLMKGKGNEFIAVPVSEVFTFKPALQRKHQSLEEAEAAMRAQRLQHERANPRLARAVARDEDDPLAILRDNEEEADSDEEWKGIKARAAARHEVKTAPQQQQRQQQRQKRGAEDEERPEEDHAERSDKGEDWEHEDVAADDDLDMGESEEEEVAGSPTRRPGASSDSEEEGAAAKLAPEKAKKRLKKMMRETGLEDSSEGEGSDEEGEEESESILDEEDLDRMAGPAGEGGAAAGAREPTPEAPLRAGAEAAAGGKKRKSPTPPPPGVLPPAAGAAEQGVKRPRTGAAAPAGAAAEAAAAAGAAAQRAAPAAAPAAAGTVTAEELRQLLRSKGRILLADLTAMYKSRLTPEGQRQFVQLVKQVAKMEPGSKYLVLKE